MSRQFIDAVCSLGNQKFSFSGHVESSTSLNKGNFAGFHAFLKNHGPLLATHLNSATVINFKYKLVLYFMKFTTLKCK
jgi:hypothetical protein